MSRPSVAGAARGTHIGVRVTADEAKAIATAAVLAGSPASVWIRDLALGAASAQPRLPTPAQRQLVAAVRELSVAVGRVGVNMNQISRHVNSEPASVMATLAKDEALAAFAETRDVLRDVLVLLEDLRPRTRRGAPQ